MEGKEGGEGGLPGDCGHGGDGAGVESWIHGVVVWEGGGG